ncbi:hypothetical protein BU17DRAFT_71476 [Hysterangium stoloniferum]|nr:hypothetical protein BU17DRAFT_71476 [Hysterangium stoloniferum]
MQHTIARHLPLITSEIEFQPLKASGGGTLGILGKCNNNKIPKPQGEPGCPNSGGYSVESELCGWSPDLLENVTRFVKNKANDTLDTTKSYKKQKSADINAICALAKKHYPVVNKYDNYWPIRDMIKLHLKYTSGIYQKQGETFCKAVRNHGTLVN